MKLRNIIYIIACLTVVLVGGACGAEPVSESRIAAPSMTEPTDGITSQAGVEPGTQFTILKSEEISKSALATDFGNLRTSDKSIALASDYLVKKGFQAQTKDENFYGIKQTFSVKSNTTGEETQGTFTMVIQDYLNKRSTDLGAVGRVSVAIGNETQDYTFNLVAPGGNFLKAVEYQVTGTQADPTRLQLVKANSWWSCVVQQIKQQCACTCVLALFECSGSWAQYISCAGSGCSCFAKAALCCACNCGRICKRFVGCCHS